MYKLAKDHEYFDLDYNFELVYSSYDDDVTGKGWYVQDQSIALDWKNSQSFETKEAAEHAYGNKGLVWGNR